ncbi:MAG TPA: hypothetical protein VJR89_03575 [Polyangiales bacterium]|nr:hypothetical protein [Polyangiales bacterium]
MLRRSHLLAACCMCVLLLVVGCAIPGDKQQAEQVLAHHFAARARGAYDAAFADYDELFFDHVTRSDWRAALSSVASKLGPVQSYEVVVTTAEQRQLAGPGSYLKYKCKVTYPKDTSLETFYLFRREGAAQFKILGHEIDSLGLLSK